MKRLLVIGTTGDYGDLDICIRAQSAGWDVKWFYLPTPRTERIGDGLVTKVYDWKKWIRWASLVLCTDNTKYTGQLEAFAKEGVRIVGCSTEAGKWELDRNCGQRIFEKSGIATLPYREFSDYDKAIAYVKRENRRFVSKPCGDEPDKSLSYVSKSPEDLVFMLQRWKKRRTLKSSFILQDFVPGIEMAVGAWFGPGGFNQGFLENWEEKPLMNDGLGPSVGESGTTMRFVKKSKLADKVLKPCEEALERSGYIGYVDVNCIIDEHGKPWPLEWTTRCGWPTTNIMQELHGDFIGMLDGLVEGRDAGDAKMDTVALGVVVAIPEYPYKGSELDKVIGVPIYGLTKDNLDQVHMANVMMGVSPQEVNGKVVDAPGPQSAGEYVLIASGSGHTVSGARASAYSVLKKLKMPASPFWRTDIGKRLQKSLPELQANGYAAGMVY